MSAPAGDFLLGVTFAATMLIGAATHHYSFTATHNSETAGTVARESGEARSSTSPTPPPTLLPTLPPTPPPTPAPTLTPKLTPATPADARRQPRPPCRAATPAATVRPVVRTVVGAVEPAQPLGQPEGDAADRRRGRDRASGRRSRRRGRVPAVRLAWVRPAGLGRAAVGPRGGAHVDDRHRAGLAVPAHVERAPTPGRGAGAGHGHGRDGTARVGAGCRRRPRLGRRWRRRAADRGGRPALASPVAPRDAAPLGA
jgi:hypothetical protein